MRGFAQLPGVVDVASLQRLSSARAAKMPVLATLTAAAADRGLRLHLVGDGAAAFADLAKSAALAERGDTRDAPAAIASTSLRSLLDLRGSPLSFALTTADGHAASTGDIKAVTKQLADTHGAATAGLCTFGGSTSSSMSMAVDLSAGGRLIDGGSAGAVADFANNTVRLTSSKPTIADAVALLVQASRHGLAVHPSSLPTVRAVFADAPKSALKGTALDESITDLIRGAADVRHTFKLLNDCGALKTLSSSSSVPSARLLSRLPLPTTAPTSPVSRAGKETAAELGVTSLWHGTFKHETRQGMTATARTTPNFFISNDKGNTAAVYGDGVYCTVAGERYEPGASGAYPFTVRLALEPDAARGVDFELVRTPEGALYVLLLRADKLRLDEQPIHRKDADAVVAGLLDPIDASPQHEVAAWSERLAEPAVAAGLLRALPTTPSSSLANLTALLQSSAQKQAAAPVFAATAAAFVRDGAFSDLLVLIDNDAGAAAVVKEALTKQAAVGDDAGVKAARFLVGFTRLFP